MISPASYPRAPYRDKHLSTHPRRPMAKWSVLQRFRYPVEPLVYCSNVILQGVDLKACCRIQDTDRRTTARALNDRQFIARAERRERSQLKAMSDHTADSPCART